MIKSNLPIRSFAKTSCCKSSAAPAPQAEAAASSATPSDSSSIDFNASPLSNKAVGLLQATADDAAKLKGNLESHEPGEIILRTKGGFSLESGSVVQDFGATVIDEFDVDKGIHKSDGGEFLHIKLPAGMSTEEAMAAMAKDERVTFAEPNYTYGLPEVIPGEMPQDGQQPAPGTATAPNDAKYSQLFGMHNEGQTGGTADADIDAPEAWAIETGRDQDHYGPTLAVIDTGIDYTHPDLAGNMWTNPGEIPGDGIDNDNNGVIDDVHGYNAYADNGDPKDGHGHGSHCAGTIGGQGNNGLGVVGVNHNANMMAIKIFSDQGRTSAAAIVKGIQYSTKMGARITGNSWGGGGRSEAIRSAFAESPAMHFAAAGNSGSNNEVRPHYPSNYDLDNIIAVAANDHNDNLARFSCYGETTVDISAPGVNIVSTVPGGYDSYSGTSMATPHAAGVGLLVATANPGISNEELRSRILEGGDEKPQLAGKVATGARLNAHGALTWTAPSNGDQG